MNHARICAFYTEAIRAAEAATNGTTNGPLVDDLLREKSEFLRTQQMPQNDKVQLQLALLADAVGELYNTLEAIGRYYIGGGKAKELEADVADMHRAFDRRLAALRSSVPSEEFEPDVPGQPCPHFPPCSESEGAVRPLPGLCKVPKCIRPEHDLSEECVNGRLESWHSAASAEIDGPHDYTRSRLFTRDNVHDALVRSEADSFVREDVLSRLDSGPSAPSELPVPSPEPETESERRIAAWETFAAGREFFGGGYTGDEIREAIREGFKAGWYAARLNPPDQPDRYTAEEIAAAMRTTFGYSSKMLLDRLAETRPLPEPSRMVRVYLSARFGRAEEVFQRGQELIQLGYDVASRWYHADADESKLTPADWARIAADDIADIERADVLVAFTEEPIGSGYVAASEVNGALRGGRQAELGYALARKLRVVVIGPRENAFHHLPGVEQFDSWDAYAATIGRAEVRS
jgi:hypothetical protein